MSADRTSGADETNGERRDRDRQPPPDRSDQTQAQPTTAGEGANKYLVKKEEATTAGTGEVKRQKYEETASPVEKSPSYGGFSDLSKELDARAQSREYTKALNANSNTSADSGLDREAASKKSSFKSEESKADADRPGKPSGADTENTRPANSVAAEKESRTNEAKRQLDIKVDDKSIREHVDPYTPKDMDAGVATGHPPRGDQMAGKDDKAESDDRPRLARFREKLAKNREDALDGVKSTADQVQGIFERPPTASHSITRTDQPIISAQQNATSAGDVATALVSGAIVLGELYRRGRDKLATRAEDRHGDNQ